MRASIRIMISILGLFALAVIASYLIRDVRRYLALRQFQGPPLSGFTRYWMQKAGTSGRLHEYYNEWVDQYGEKPANALSTSYEI